MAITNKKAFNLSIAAMFTALIVVLQMISYFVKVGPISITLVLIPVVLGGVLLGPSYGAYFGGVFGFVVMICTITGIDPGAHILFEASPFVTIVLCLFKGVMAGWLSALVYKRSKSSLLAAITAPIVNTGIFLACMPLFFYDILNIWAGGKNIIVYLLIGLTGWNFVVEFISNVILCPVIKRAVKAFKNV